MPSKKIFQNLNSLSKNSKESDEDFKKITKELVEGDDRASALIAVASLERHLEDFLKYKMEHLNSDEIKHLFDSNGPLGNFSSRIYMAYAFKLLKKPMLNDLIAIKNIRNAFAHSHKAISFNTSAVEAACKTLKSFPNKGFKETREIFIWHCLRLNGFFLKKEMSYLKAKVKRKSPRSNASALESLLNFLESPSDRPHN